MGLKWYLTYLKIEIIWMSPGGILNKCTSFLKPGVVLILYEKLCSYIHPKREQTMGEYSKFFPLLSFNNLWPCISKTANTSR